MMEGGKSGRQRPKERRSRNHSPEIPRLALQYFEEHGYHAIGVIGKGGYATVYIACRKNRNEYYAVKVNFGTVRL